MNVLPLRIKHRCLSQSRLIKQHHQRAERLLLIQTKNRNPHVGRTVPSMQVLLQPWRVKISCLYLKCAVPNNSDLKAWLAQGRTASCQMPTWTAWPS